MRTAFFIGFLAIASIAAAQDATTTLPLLKEGAGGDSARVVERTNTFMLDAQLMTRGELRRGGLANENDPTSDKANFILARTRLSVGYDKSDWLQMRVTAQHNGVWGQEGKGNFNLYEAWAGVRAHWGGFAKFGRQSLSYDDERIIGKNDWSMAAFSHDCLKLGWEGHGHKVHAIGAFNQNAANINGGTTYLNGAQAYKSWLTLWYHYELPFSSTFKKDKNGGLLGISLIAMDTGMQSILDIEKPKTEHQQLIGGFLRFTPKHWLVEGSYYHQFGHNEDKIKINAWMASALARYSPIKQLHLTAGFDYLSGDKYFAVPRQGGLGLVRHDVIRGFNPIYGSHHRFYGMMDFFYVSTYYGGFTPGLQNLYFRVGGEPLKGLHIDGSYHYLATATKLEDMGMTLGHEFELNIAYRIIKEVNVAFGYSVMNGSSNMERLKRSAAGTKLRWAWLSVTVSPRIFSIKW
ncbi:MAG: hypothetical protein IJU62_04080 [Muribaculaceae bacterium]|nr:hypothetical protein [Muribaculaceae bacterium]